MLRFDYLEERNPGGAAFVPPPMREELPTLPYDLTEYARIHIGPYSPSAGYEDSADEGDAMEAPFDEAFQRLESGSLALVRRSDVPRVALSPEEIIEHRIDHREGFILSLLDGCSTLESVLTIAGLPEADALAVVCDLFARGIITLEPKPIHRGEYE